MRRWVLSAVFLYCIVVLSVAQAAAPATPLQSTTEGWFTYANADRVRVLRARDGTLWAGSEGGGLVGWDVTNGPPTEGSDDDFVHLLYPQDKLAGNTVTAITITPDGTLWAATTGGVSRYPPNALGQNFTFKNTSRRLENRAEVVQLARTGENQVRLNLTSESAVLSAFSPGYLMFGTDETIYFYRGWDQVTHEVFVEPGLRRSVEPGTPVYAVEIGLAADKVRDVVVDQAGRVWISTVNGVSVYDGGEWTVYTKYNTQPPMVANDVGPMAVDRENRVWMAHSELGQFTMYDDGVWHTEYQVAGVIQSLAVNPDDGKVWAATNELCPTVNCYGGGVWSFTGDDWVQRYTSGDGIANNNVYSIAFGDAGRVWLGHEKAVSRRTGSGWQVYAFNDKAEAVRRVIEDDYDAILKTRTPSDLWAVSAGRVWTRHLGAVRGYSPGDGWQDLYTGVSGLNSNETRVVATDEAGRVWVGAHRTFDGHGQVGGGINFWDGSHWTHYTAENSDLPDNLVSKIAAGRGVVWVKTQTGFSHFYDGEWTRYENVSSLVEDDYWSIIDAKDMPGINDNRLWTIDNADRVWIWDGTGASYFRPDTGWVSYTFQDTLEKTAAKTYAQRHSSLGESIVWVSAEDIGDSAAAQDAFSTGYLMIGDDPGLYRYESFAANSQPGISGIQVTPPFRANVEPNAPVYAVVPGLLSNIVNDVTVGAGGRVWFANAPQQWLSTNVYGGVSVLDVESGTWEHYTVRNTSRRGALVGRMTEDVPAGQQKVPADFASQNAADQALASGFVMFEGDPSDDPGGDLTVYQYLGFSDGALTVRPIFSSPLGQVGVQKALPADTRIYAVELGLLGAPGGEAWADRLAVDSAGRMWIVVSGVGISVLDSGGGWTTYRPRDDGLADERISGMLVRGTEVWIWTAGKGVSVFRDGNWQTYNVFNTGLVDDDVESLAITVNGEAWMATRTRGISVVTLPGFRLDTGSNVVLAEPGGTGTLHFDVVPVGGFSASVALSIEGLPPGVAARFTPDSVIGGGGVDLSLDVSAPVAPGPYPLTILGRSPEGLTTARSLTLLVVSTLHTANLPLITR